MRVKVRAVNWLGLGKGAGKYIMPVCTKYKNVCVYDLEVYVHTLFISVLFYCVQMVAQDIRV